MLTQSEAVDSVARHQERPAVDFVAKEAPRDSVHEGIWYVWERESCVDDCVWIVVRYGWVTRAIPTGHPFTPPTP